jgi:hypothetical protein
MKKMEKEMASKLQAEIALEKLERAIPLLKKTIDMTSYESMVAEYSDKAAGISNVHVIVERLNRLNSLLMSLCMQHTHSIRVKMALISDFTSVIFSRIEQSNTLIVNLSRLKSVIDTKQGYINMLDQKIQQISIQNSFESNIDKLSQLALISREFAPLETLR